MDRRCKHTFRPGFDDLEGRQLLSTLPETSLFSAGHRQFQRQDLHRLDGDRWPPQCRVVVRWHDLRQQGHPRSDQQCRSGWPASAEASTSPGRGPMAASMSSRRPMARPSATRSISIRPAMPVRRRPASAETSTSPGRGPMAASMSSRRPMARPSATRSPSIRPAMPVRRWPASAEASTSPGRGPMAASMSSRRPMARPSATRSILNQTSNAGPALASFGGDLDIAWTGTDGRLNVESSSDGTTFGNQVILNQTSNAGPALASFGGDLDIAWTGTDGRLNVTI